MSTDSRETLPPPGKVYYYCIFVSYYVYLYLHFKHWFSIIYIYLLFIFVDNRRFFANGCVQTIELVLFHISTPCYILKTFSNEMH